MPLIYLLSLLLLLLSALPANSNTAPLATQASPSIPLTCRSSNPESHILCEASALQDASVAQVISEDGTAHLENTPSPSQTADDVWTAAYQQWINPRTTSKSAQRALDEVRKRFGEIPDHGQDSEQNFAEDLESLDDDEATKITHYAQIISSKNVPVKDLLDTLEDVELLCASGDNGRQMAAVGGVKVLVQLFAHAAVGVVSGAMRALASCAQNNPSVFKIAMQENAVDKLVDVAMESEGEISLRAAALRALVAVMDGSEGAARLWERREDVAAIVREVVGWGGWGMDERRCLIRGLALAEKCLTSNRTWRDTFGEVKLSEAVEIAIESTDANVREGVARVLQMLRRNDAIDAEEIH